MTISSRGFASDNCSGVHPKIMKELEAANSAHVPSYGEDPFTAEAVAKIREHFGDGCDVYFVWGGTAANILGLRTVTRSYNAVICPESAHINSSECCAPETNIGCKLISAPVADGKMTVELLGALTDADTDAHHAQPKVVSISQATEKGTVYSIDEIKALSGFAHEKGLLLHMDGARLSNAAVSLGCGFREMTFDAGVDILSFGGTKNGLMFGEAVIFRDRSHEHEFKYIRMQGLQLYSKMRFAAAQFSAMLDEGLAFDIARHSNMMASVLGRLLSEIPGITLTQKVESNAVFAIIPEHCLERLRERFDFFVFDEKRSEVRLMCSFDTTEEDVRDFAGIARAVLESSPQ